MKVHGKKEVKKDVDLSKVCIARHGNLIMYRSGEKIEYDSINAAKREVRAYRAGNANAPSIASSHGDKPTAINRLSAHLGSIAKTAEIARLLAEKIKLGDQA